MLRTRMMFALETGVDLIREATRQLVPWLVALAITAVALFALSDGYFE
jgi:hypothetical protein